LYGFLFSVPGQAEGFRQEQCGVVQWQALYGGAQIQEKIENRRGGLGSPPQAGPRIEITLARLQPNADVPCSVATQRLIEPDVQNPRIWFSDKYSHRRRPPNFSVAPTHYRSNLRAMVVPREGSTPA
jgi:hypothetical protein